MPKCEQCDKEVVLPFECNYCGHLFCAEHRLPESHECPSLPTEAPWHLRGEESEEQIKQTPSIERKRPYSGEVEASNKKDWLHFQKGKTWEKKQRQSERRSHVLSVLAFSAFVIILCIIVLNSAILKDAIVPDLPNLPNVSPRTYSHDELAAYALWLINSDRHNNGLENVTLSNTQCAQQHAADMLRNNYFSHWDLRGFKPYMRYTLVGGKGSVAENCAAQLGYHSDLKDTLKQLEWSMVYDDASSNWGHKYNILDPFHNKVGIGIAYDNNNVYLFQDFEDDHVSWSMLTCSNNQVTMRGTLTK